MNKSRQIQLSSVLLFGIAAAVLCLQSPNFAEESQKATECKAACKNNCQVRVEVRGKIPLLDKIPFVQYFLPTNNGVQTAIATDKKPHQAVFERIGVDFDLLPGHMISFLPDGESQVLCSESECKACEGPCTGWLTTAVSKSSAACTGEACAPCDSSAAYSACDLAATKVSRGKLASTGCQETEGSQSCLGRHAFCDELIELRAANSALEAALDAQESLMEARSEMMNSMLEIASEKARLEAHIALVADRDEIREQLLELLTENAKLKAQAELAEERQAMHKEQAELAVANERLKLRVAELESGQRSTSEPARTAKRPRTAKKNVSTR